MVVLKEELTSSLVYRHIRLDTNEVFYIGIGNDKRPYSKYNRNKYWKNIVNKVGYVVEIIATGLSWVDACELEILLIKEYGRSDLGLGNLVNMTDGGDGNNNMSLESRKSISDSVKIRNTGSKHSIETIEKMKIKDFGTIDCLMCDNNFIKKHIRQTTCSPSCRQKHYRTLDRNQEDRNCIKCGIIFNTYKYEKQKTCSIQCGWSNQFVNKQK